MIRAYRKSSMETVYVFHDSKDMAAIFGVGVDSSIVTASRIRSHIEIFKLPALVWQQAWNKEGAEEFHYKDLLEVLTGSKKEVNCKWRVHGGNLSSSTSAPAPMSTTSGRSSSSGSTVFFEANEGLGLDGRDEGNGEEEGNNENDEDIQLQMPIVASAYCEIRIFIASDIPSFQPFKCSLDGFTISANILFAFSQKQGQPRPSYVISVQATFSTQGTVKEVGLENGIKQQGTLHDVLTVQYKPNGHNQAGVYDIEAVNSKSCTTSIRDGTTSSHGIEGSLEGTATAGLKFMGAHGLLSAKAAGKITKGHTKTLEELIGQNVAYYGDSRFEVYANHQPAYGLVEYGAMHVPPLGTLAKKLVSLGAKDEVIPIWLGRGVTIDFRACYNLFDGGVLPYTFEAKRQLLQVDILPQEKFHTMKKLLKKLGSKETIHMETQVYKENIWINNDFDWQIYSGKYLFVQKGGAGAGAAMGILTLH